jgi:hypothetical protein
MAYIYDRAVAEYMYHAMYTMTMTGPPGENAVLRRVSLAIAIGDAKWRLAGHLNPLVIVTDTHRRHHKYSMQCISRSSIESAIHEGHVVSSTFPVRAFYPPSCSA